MIYYTGAAVSGELRKILQSNKNIGLLNTPDVGYSVELTGSFLGGWAADNACYANPKKYSDERYFKWLDRMSGIKEKCKFATAPDVLGDAAATLKRSAPVFAGIRARGFKPALVAQDGMESFSLPWRDFSCLFIGGSTRWKISQACRDLVGEAVRRGKWAHFGRTNSARRIVLAQDMGCGSADGNHIGFSPQENTKNVLRWLEALELDRRQVKFL